MARSITVGNGNLLIGIDTRGQVRDLYFPYVGHSNQISGASGSYQHRVGIWIDGVLHWLSDAKWSVYTQSDACAAVGRTRAVNDTLGIELSITDVVHNEINVFLRHIDVKNVRDEQRTIKVFFGQEFRISESRRGDTAFYDPRVQAIIHYKGHSAFLINASIQNNPFDDYSVGLFDIEGRVGTYADAEDGTLSKNTIEHGSVDSVIGLTCKAQPGETIGVDYWIAAGEKIQEVHALNQHVVSETPKRLRESTEKYWHAWMKKEGRDFSYLDEKLQKLYMQSLGVIRIHADNHGGIIASSDTDILNQGRDTYSYVWPRDAAVIAHALDRAGYLDTAQRFYTFMAKLLEPDGYLMHKYRVDGVLGSSWHPWVRNGVLELPIQEDETALVVYMLWKHYLIARDVEFIESLYNTFIEPTADFLSGYIERETGLPCASYELWEEKYGTATYTTAAVYGALHAAAEISTLLGKRDNATKYRERAAMIKEALLTYLYDPKLEYFVKLVRQEDGKLFYDKTIDTSSFHGIVFFGVLDPHDKRVTQAFQTLKKTLLVPTSYGGFMRYEGDQYYKTSHDAPPNAWCVTTLWVAQYYIKQAERIDDLRFAYELLEWVHAQALESGILPEQIHPYTGAHLSVAPLIWSHAEFVITVDEYLHKMRTLSEVKG